MDEKTHEYKKLSETYLNFSTPSFEIKIGDKAVDILKMGITDINVDLTVGNEASGFSFKVVDAFDVKKRDFKDDCLNKVFCPGKIVKVSLGYIKHVLVFMGYIDSVSVSYMGRGPEIKVSCLDAKGVLMNGLEQEHQGEKNLKQVITDILNQCVSEKVAEKVEVGDIKDVKRPLVQNYKTDYEYLSGLAKNYNFEFFVVCGEVRFMPARKVKPKIMTLEWGINIISFSRDLSLTGQVYEVTVTGVNPQTNERVKGVASAMTKSGTGKTAPDMVGFIKKAKEERHIPEVVSDDEAKMYAEAILDLASMRYVSATLTCIGIPELIPGRFIELKGLGKGIANTYYIKKVQHRLDNSGYLTTLTLGGNVT